MKLIILILLSASAFADDGGVKKEVLEKFLKDKGPCYLAVGKEIAQGSYYPDVLCVMDVASNSGTVNEQSGCGLTVFNTRTAAYKGTSRGPTGKLSLVMAKTSCSKGGFHELMGKETISGSGILVKQSLKTGKGTMYQPSLLIYTHGPGFKEAFDKL